MWHPSSEAEASCELAALLEFLRATRGLGELAPDGLWDWHLTDPAGFAEAFSAYDPNTNTAERISAVFAEFQVITSSLRA
jgi:hypothetical protein